MWSIEKVDLPIKSRCEKGKCDGNILINVIWNVNDIFQGSILIYLYLNINMAIEDTHTLFRQTKKQTFLSI